MDVGKVYGIGYVPDRRQISMPVNVDRRSGVDRRISPRLALDSKVKQDVYETRAFLKNTLKTDVFENSVTKKQVSFGSAYFNANKLIKKPGLASFLDQNLMRMALPMMDVMGMFGAKTTKDRTKSVIKSVSRVSGACLAMAGGYALFPAAVSSLTPLVITGIALGAVGAFMGNNVANKINKNL